MNQKILRRNIKITLEYIRKEVDQAEKYGLDKPHPATLYTCSTNILRLAGELSHLAGRQRGVDTK